MVNETSDTHPVGGLEKAFEDPTRIFQRWMLAKNTRERQIGE